jgi:hypothetical protein
VKIYVEIEANRSAMNEVCQIITRAIQVKGVQRFLLSDNLKVKEEKEDGIEKEKL